MPGSKQQLVVGVGFIASFVVYHICPYREWKWSEVGEGGRNCHYGQGQLMLISTYLTFQVSILQSCLHHSKLKNHFYRQFCYKMVTESYPYVGAWPQTHKQGWETQPNVIQHVQKSWGSKVSNSQVYISNLNWKLDRAILSWFKWEEKPGLLSWEEKDKFTV